MTTKHTPGPWRIVDREIMEDGSVYPCHILGGAADYQVCTLESPDIAKHGVEKPHLFPGLNGVLGPNARLIAAAPELLEALEEAVDLAWVEDSHQVQFDTTVLFSEFYDFSGVDGTRRIEFYGQHECIVWPGAKWSAYCTYDGSMWFEKFDTAEEAKEACMQLLDRVMPDHPAMRARAVIRKARGAQ